MESDLHQSAWVPRLHIQFTLVLDDRVRSLFFKIHCHFFFQLREVHLESGLTHGIAVSSNNA
jgi:hypothetical protein